METNLPKYIPENPYNYSNLEKAKRKRDIKAMIRDFPTVSPMWVEWIYDVIENMPKEEVDKIVNEGLWEGPSKFSKAQGGLIHTVECFNEDGTEYQFPPKENESLAITAE
jgi:hypothetical protein